jgi:hypothetical protein
LASEPRWRAGLLAAMISVAIGAAINDSGVAIPAIAACVVVPVLIWISLRWRPSEDVPTAESVRDTPSLTVDAARPRVSVNSREPTG